MSVLVYGFSTCDIIFDNVSSEIMTIDKCSVFPPTITTGGDALNVSKILSRLDVNVSLVSSLGKDMYGDIVMNDIKSFNIDDEHVRIVDNAHTAVSYVLLDYEKERHFIAVDDILNEMNFTEKEISLAKEFDYVYFGSALLMKKIDTESLGKIMKKAKENNSITFMDAAVNYDADEKQKEAVLNSLIYVDYFIPSIDEVELLTGTRDIESAFEVFRNYGCNNIVIKDGSEGAHISFEGRKVTVSPNRIRNVIDTTGAGDSFVGGFIYSIMQGYSIEKACEIGNRVAGITIQHKGVGEGINKMIVDQGGEIKFTIE